MLFLLLPIIFIYLYSVKISNTPTRIIEEYLFDKSNEKANITIFSHETVFDYKILGFQMLGSNYGFTVFKVKDSQYTLLYCFTYHEMVKRATDVFIKYVDLFDAQNNLVSYLIVLSLNDMLSEIQKFENNNTPIIYTIEKNPSITLVRYPTDTSTEYIFFDKFHNIIS